MKWVLYPVNDPTRPIVVATPTGDTVHRDIILAWIALLATPATWN